MSFAERDCKSKTWPDLQTLHDMSGQKWKGVVLDVCIFNTRPMTESKRAKAGQKQRPFSKVAGGKKPQHDGVATREAPRSVASCFGWREDSAKR